jgi:hypothetical protein
MRRLLRSIAKNENITQDVSTLENPAILEQLKQALYRRRDSGAPADRAAPGQSDRAHAGGGAVSE